jgi:tetratricopeptide (TPR) repeat protein/DNA-binding MarR family transcriptional regulator
MVVAPFYRRRGQELSRTTVFDRIVLHLREYNRERDSFYLSPEVTQRGISRAIGSARAGVTHEIKRLIEEGYAEEDRRKVEGAKGTRKCYFLTMKGMDYAAEMREAILDKEITLRDMDGSEARVSGKEALGTLRRAAGLSAPRAMEEIAATDFVDLTLFERLPPRRPFPLPEKFFGREEELDRLSELLEVSTPDARTPLVISLMGVTGVGKTSLAAKVASEYKGASFFHRTHEWDTPSTVMRALASFLKGRGRDRMSRYAKSLQPDPRELALVLREDMQSGLLVFDDCHKSEHVQSFLSALMDMGENWAVRIIAVSRRKPSFYNRADITVKGLVGEFSLGGLDRDAARALLESHHGTLGDDAFEEIYSLTEGHPMQLLLVSADRLSETEGSKDEHLTYVHEAIVPELTEEEEEVLARCSVFRDSFPPEALGPVSQKTIEDLVERSILLEDGEDYSMHEIVKEFILEGLRKDEKRHRRYHSLAADIYLKRDEAYPRLYHLVQAGRRPEALRLVKKKAVDFISRGLSEEMAGIIEELQRDHEDDPLLTMIRARISEAMGRTERALDLYERAGKLGGPIDKMESSIRIGTLAANVEDFTSSEEFFERALHFSRKADNPVGEANAYRGLGMLSLQKGDYDEAVKLLKTSRSRYSDTENEEELSKTLKLQGIAQMHKGELFASRKSLERSLEMSQGDQNEGAEILNHLGTVLLRMNELEEAGERLEQSVDLAHESGQMRIACLAMCNLANVLLELDESKRASELCERSLDIASGLEDPEVTSSVYVTMANILARREKPDKAMGYLEKSIVLLRDSDDRKTMADRLFQLSELKLADGSKSEAMKLKKEAFRMLNSKPQK